MLDQPSTTKPTTQRKTTSFDGIRTRGPSTDKHSIGQLLIFTGDLDCHHDDDDDGDDSDDESEETMMVMTRWDILVNKIIAVFSSLPRLVIIIS